jgi:hypothetical protein
MILAACSAAGCVVLGSGPATILAAGSIVFLGVPAALVLGCSFALSHTIVKETVKAVVEEVVRPVIRRVIRFFRDLWRRVVRPTRAASATASPARA